MIWKLRHRLAWDLTAIENRDHRAVIQSALNACSYPFARIRRRTGKRVPVSVADLSRYSAALGDTGHAHVSDETGAEGHLLGDPARRAALGLYFLPTPQYPAGRVEIDTGAMRDADLAREVFLAEGAHAVDYGAMTDGQRVQVMALFDYKGAGPAPAGWFEEQGEGTYWRWRGERWMSLFTAAYASSLPRPLEPRQPWQWSFDATDVAAVRSILR